MENRRPILHLAKAGVIRKEWTGMAFASSTRAVEDRTRWKGTVFKSSGVVQQLARLWDRLD